MKGEMQLYGRDRRRLYINNQERRSLIEQASRLPLPIKTFILTLIYTGCRLSEIRELNTYSIHAEDQVLSIRSLKKRNQHHMREIPIPETLKQLLIKQSQSHPYHYLWSSLEGSPINRITAYRWVKQVMDTCHIRGSHACPKGLRHGFGIHAIRSGVQLNMLQKWMGHTTLSTTAIYANAVGKEELEIATKMW